MLSPWGQQHRHTLQWAWQPWTRRQSSAVFGIFGIYMRDSNTWNACRLPWGEALCLQLVWKASHRLCRPIRFGIWPRPKDMIISYNIQLQKEQYYFQDFLDRFPEVSAFCIFAQNVPMLCHVIIWSNVVECHRGRAEHCAGQYRFEAEDKAFHELFLVAWIWFKCISMHFNFQQLLLDWTSECASNLWWCNIIQLSICRALLVRVLLQSGGDFVKLKSQQNQGGF